MITVVWRSQVLINTNGFSITFELIKIHWSTLIDIFPTVLT